MKSIFEKYNLIMNKIILEIFLLINMKENLYFKNKI
jgi:hypothetical protein